ncbi:MAG: DUF6512 family protein [Candidatus Caldarchaeum sp.]
MVTTQQKHQTLLKATEVAGIFFIVLMGSLLHFTYELSGENVVVGLISAVNESVWEHLKLPFFPALFLGAAQHPVMRKTYPNFWLGKAVGTFSMPLIIVVGFYAYKAVFGGHNLAYDIGLFIASVMIGQLVSYRLISQTGAKPFNILPLAALIVMAVIFMVFTIAPPRLEIFQDPLTGGFGLEGHSHL